MAKRGNKPLEKKDAIITTSTLHCFCCGEEYDINDFYDSDSDFYKASGKLPYCKKCIEEIYQKYLIKYTTAGICNPEKKAMERLCMAFGLFYDNDIFDGAMKRNSSNSDESTTTSLYFRQVKLYQYRNKDYDTTIQKKIDSVDGMGTFSADELKESQIISDAEKFFGTGFSDDDYLFLKEQYDDWTTRHECETKSQEEIFKQLCFTQLQLLKAQRAKEDTKDLNATFLKQLEVAKLQPKQNHNESNSNAQTFGTLIDKWENTRPIPEIDEDLRDVDKIGLYLDVFFKGHLAKMMGLKNGLSNLYTKFMKKYTVERPEYDDDEDGEALFDAIFGNSANEDM